MEYPTQGNVTRLDRSLFKCSCELMIGAFPIPGNRCWANFCGSYGLPKGLADRTPLLILDWCEFRGRFRDESGMIWELCRVQIDTGFSFYLDGEEFHESHPRCAAYLRHSVEKQARILRESLDDWKHATSRFDCEGQLSRTRWYLERNGYDPDTPLPPGPIPKATATPKGRSASNPRMPIRNTGDSPRRMNS